VAVLDAVDTFAVPPRTLLVRVRDHDGAEGWGEAGGDVLAPAVAEAIRAAAPLLVGREAGRIEEARRLVALAGFWRGGPVLGAAAAGVEAALWDLLGRRLGAPVHALLGGAGPRPRPTYAWVDAEPHAATAEAAAEEAAQLVGRGFRTVKAVPDRAARARSRRGRRSATPCDGPRRSGRGGPDVGLIVDFHGRAGPAAARRLIAALDHVQPLFIEEPVLPEHADRLADVRGTSPRRWRPASGLHDRAAAARLLAAGVDVIQPDVALCGGLLELLRIARSRRTPVPSSRPTAPSGPWPWRRACSAR
jgi:galactonate dehydratase